MVKESCNFSSQNRRLSRKASLVLCTLRVQGNNEHSLYVSFKKNLIPASWTRTWWAKNYEEAAEMSMNHSRETTQQQHKQVCHHLDFVLVFLSTHEKISTSTAIWYRNVLIVSDGFKSSKTLWHSFPTIHDEHKQWTQAYYGCPWYSYTLDPFTSSFRPPKFGLLIYYEINNYVL